MKFNQPESKEP